MADAKDKPTPNLLQKFETWVLDVVKWVEETFGDPQMSTLIRADLGFDTAHPIPDVAVSDATKNTIAEFIGKSSKDVDTAAFLATAQEVVTLVQTGMTFADAVKTQSVGAQDIIWLLFKLWVNDFLRSRNPAAYGLMTLAGLLVEDEETLGQLDLQPLVGWVTGDWDPDAFVDRLSFVLGTTVVVLEALVKALDGAIDALYGWDPAPGDSPDAAAVAGRMLSVLLHIPVTDTVSADPMLTLVMVPTTHGGPGIVLSVGGRLDLTTTIGTRSLELILGANGAFTAYLGKGDPVAVGGFAPSLALRLEPGPAVGAGTGGGGAAGGSSGVAGPSPSAALVAGFADACFIEIGGFAFGLEVGADHAGARITARRGRVVVNLGQGDGFLSKLPAVGIEVPFDLGMLADTKQGIRFDGGTGLKVNLPVAASIGGVLTIQYLQLELTIGQVMMLEARGGFSIKLGPFSASVDQIGVGTDLTKLAAGKGAEAVRFLPPRGVGLRIDASVVKGGGYLFIDPDHGEYAGALELTIAGTISIKAIALITTKRPDGSDGWSFLLMIFGQFSVHIAYGIFLTGVGGMIGLHHRVDTDALIAGMKTGALDDVLFPANPVADAPRIIQRYKQLFPIEENSLVLGPMLELAYSKPPIIYIRLGLVFEIANALGGDKPLALTKVVLIGQLQAQLPPKVTGAPAIVKIIVDIVGFYDAQEQFLMIRARLRDSFIGIEGFATLNISGELMVAMRFGADPTFVLSAGGYHPAFKDVPKGIPATLDRLAVSFAIGPISIRAEVYFAVTSNSLQAGLKVTLTAKLGPASIQGLLAFDALMYLSPHLHFIIELTFSVSVKAFDHTLCSVNVHMSLEGPGAWHAVGSFSFSILFWDVEIGFDESWGDAPAVTSQQTSAIEAVKQEIKDPAHLLPGPPVGGDALVTIAEVTGSTLPVAHPLAVLSVQQKAVPFGVRIDRIGTATLTEGTAQFAIGAVKVGTQPTTAVAPVLDSFARGHYMELSEADKLGGKSFDRFACGITVGTDAYLVSQSREVAATYEEKVLEPEPHIARFPWALRPLTARTLPDALVDLHVSMGAAARSARAAKDSLLSGGPGAAVVSHDPAREVVDSGTLTATVSVIGDSRDSLAVAEQAAAATGAIVVESFELAVR